MLWGQNTLSVYHYIAFSLTLETVFSPHIALCECGETQAGKKIHITMAHDVLIFSTAEWMDHRAMRSLDTNKSYSPNEETWM